MLVNRYDLIKVVDEDKISSIIQVLVKYGSVEAKSMVIPSMRRGVQTSSYALINHCNISTAIIRLLEKAKYGHPRWESRMNKKAKELHEIRYKIRKLTKSN